MSTLVLSFYYIRSSRVYAFVFCVFYLSIISAYLRWPTITSTSLHSLSLQRRSVRSESHSIAQARLSVLALGFPVLTLVQSVDVSSSNAIVKASTSPLRLDMRSVEHTPVPCSNCKRRGCISQCWGVDMEEHQ